jgi:hypothetical protein
MIRSVSQRRKLPFTHVLGSGKSFSLSNIERKVDKKLVRRVVGLTRRLEQILAEAVPDSSRYTRSGMASDLADLWHASEELRKCISELLNLRFPRDKKRFRDLVLLIDPLLIQHIEWHTRRLKKRRKEILREAKA